MIFVIAKAELLKLFKTGKILTLLAVVQCILGLIFYWLTEEFLSKSQRLLVENTRSLGVTEEVVHPLFAWAALFFFLLIPLLTANTISQEKKSHTLALYLTSPLSKTEIVLGKFIGLLATQSMLLLPLLLMSLFIAVNGRLDIGQFISQVLGLFLLLGASLSLGLFVSSQSKEPLLAALVTFMLLILLSLLEWMARFLPPVLNWIGEFSLIYHSKNFLSGFISTQAIIYYLLFAFVFLSLSIYGMNYETRS